MVAQGFGWRDGRCWMSETEADVEEGEEEDVQVGEGEKECVGEVGDLGAVA